jgi:hypothetical protein
MKFNKPMNISGNWDVVTKRYRAPRTIYTWEELDAEIYYAKVQVAWQTCPRRIDGFPDMRYKVNREPQEFADIGEIRHVPLRYICYTIKKGYDGFLGEGGI